MKQLVIIVRDENYMNILITITRNKNIKTFIKYINTLKIIYNVIHNRPVYIIVLYTFLLHYNLPIIVRNYNTKKSIILYIVIFLRCLFNLLTDSYIIVSLITSPATS